MMKRAALVSCALIRIAAAEEVHDARVIAIETAAISEAIASADPAAAGFARMRASLNAIEILGNRFGYRAEIGADGELRIATGSLPRHGAAWSVHGGFADQPLVDGGPAFGFAALDIEVGQELDALPRLRDPRDLLRLPYDRTQLRGDMAYVRFRPPGSHWRHSIVDLELTMTKDLQRAGDLVFARRASRVAFDVSSHCRAPDADPLCIRIIHYGVGGTHGEHAMASGFLMPVHVDGIAVSDAVRIDVGMGVIGGRYDIEANAGSGDCTATGACITLFTPGYRFAVRAAAPRADKLELGRRTYETMTNELAIEDRAAATTSWEYRRFAFSAYAYAAYTQWWGALDRRLGKLGSGVTGGADVTMSCAIGPWTIESAIAAGRSWYGTPDGDAPRAGLGAQGTLALRHDWRKRWP